MPRGRIISPDFWSDGNMVGLSAFARLFYIGTWNFAYCDKGHLPDDAVGLKLKILPADQVDAKALIEELMSCERLTRITAADGKTYLHIPTFETYQKADTRWKSRCPVCQASPKLTETQESLVEHAETLPNSALRGGGEERRGDEKEREGEASNVAPPRRCPKHLNDTYPPACGNCKEARVRYEQWAENHTPAPVSTPRPPRASEITAAKVCEQGIHKPDSEGMCLLCAQPLPKLRAVAS